LTIGNGQIYAYNHYLREKQRQEYHISQPRTILFSGMTAKCCGATFSAYVPEIRATGTVAATEDGMTAKCGDVMFNAFVPGIRATGDGRPYNRVHCLFIVDFRLAGDRGRSPLQCLCF